MQKLNVFNLISLDGYYAGKCLTIPGSGTIVKQLSEQPLRLARSRLVGNGNMLLIYEPA